MNLSFKLFVPQLVRHRNGYLEKLFGRVRLGMRLFIMAIAGPEQYRASNTVAGGARINAGDAFNPPSTTYWTLFEHAMESLPRVLQCGPDYV